MNEVEKLKKENRALKKALKTLKKREEIWLTEEGLYKLEIINKALHN